MQEVRQFLEIGQTTPLALDASVTGVGEDIKSPHLRRYTDNPQVAISFRRMRRGGLEMVYQVVEVSEARM